MKSSNTSAQNHRRIGNNGESRNRLALACAAVVLCGAHAFADDWPQWRGPNRDGISRETGLLKEWPKDGPKMLWSVKEIGSGYSTPSIVGERLYLCGNEGIDNEFVEALEVKTGKKMWSTKLGKVGNPDQQPRFPAARSTPTVEGDVLYALGSDGDLVCMETAGGKDRWRKNLRTDFGGEPGVWAYSESPLIEGDTLICTPGGSEATLVALNKKSGEVKWKCAVPGGDPAAYASAILVKVDGNKECVQLLQKGLVGVDAESGKFLWRFSKPVSKFNANIPTPVADGAYIYSGSAGTGGGLAEIKGKPGALEAQEIYFNSKLPTAIGGAVKSGKYLYGTTGQALLCVDFASGAVKWEERALGAAALCCADGNLYLHGENGNVALVEANSDAYHEKGRFSPPDQPKRLNPMEKAWAYPVVANGHFYIRDQDRLWCYDVGAAK